MKTSEYAQGVAMTIFDQLGGNAFAIMTGARDFQFGTEQEGDFLRVSLPRASKAIQRVQIVYDLGNDVYIMKFLKANMNVVSRFTMVHVEDLHGIFEDETGLLASL